MPRRHSRILGGPENLQSLGSQSKHSVKPGASVSGRHSCVWDKTYKSTAQGSWGPSLWHAHDYEGTHAPPPPPAHQLSEAASWTQESKQESRTET